jgi:hypothetical protein
MIPQIVFNPRPRELLSRTRFLAGPRGTPYQRHHNAPPSRHGVPSRVPQKPGTAKDARAFLKEVFPHLVASHRYFLPPAGPRGTGLVYIRHPWESGLDNSPS